MLYLAAEPALFLSLPEREKPKFCFKRSVEERGRKNVWKKASLTNGGFQREKGRKRRSSVAK